MLERNSAEQPSSPSAPLLPRVITATPAEFDELVANNQSELLLLYLWGTNCPNCEFFAKRLPTLVQALSGAPLCIVKVDAYLHPDFATRLGVFGIPHFVLFWRGERLGKMSEFRGDAFFLAVIREHLPR